MDPEGEVPGQKGGAKVHIGQSKEAQTTNPTNGGTAGGKAGFQKQTIPLHLPGLVGAHHGEVYGETEGQHEGVAVVGCMPVHGSSKLQINARVWNTSLFATMVKIYSYPG